RRGAEVVREGGRSERRRRGFQPGHDVRRGPRRGEGQSDGGEVVQKGRRAGQRQRDVQPGRDVREGPGGEEGPGRGAEVVQEGRRDGRQGGEEEGRGAGGRLLIAFLTTESQRAQRRPEESSWSSLCSL